MKLFKLIVGDLLLFLAKLTCYEFFDLCYHLDQRGHLLLPLCESVQVLLPLSQNNDCINRNAFGPGIFLVCGGHNAAVIYEYSFHGRLLMASKLMKVHTLQIKSLKLLFMFQAGLQVSQGNMSQKQRLHQGLHCVHAAVDNLHCRVIHPDRLPITWGQEK